MLGSRLSLSALSAFVIFLLTAVHAPTALAARGVKVPQEWLEQNLTLLRQEYGLEIQVENGHANKTFLAKLKLFPPEQIRAVNDLLESYLGSRNLVSGVIRKAPSSWCFFAVRGTTKIIPVLSVLSKYLSRDQISSRLQADLQGIAMTDAKKLEGVLGVLSRYLNHDQIAARMQADLLGFARTDADKLNGVLEVLSEYLDRSQISARMQIDLLGFAGTDAEKLEGVLAILNKYLNREQISVRMLADLQSFARTDAEKLEGVLTVLTKYLNHGQISVRMEADLQGFANTDAEKLKGVLSVLSEYLNRDQISSRMQAALQGFAIIDAEKLKGILTVLSDYLDRDQISSRMLADLQGFARTDAKKLREVLEILKAFGLTQEQIAVRIEESLQAFGIDPETLKLRLALYERYLGREMTIKRIVGWHPERGTARPGSLTAISFIPHEQVEPLLQRYSQTVGPSVIREELWRTVRARFSGIKPEVWDAALNELEAQYPNQLVRDAFAIENGPKGILKWYRDRHPAECVTLLESGS